MSHFCEREQHCDLQPNLFRHPKLQRTATSSSRPPHDALSFFRKEYQKSKKKILRPKKNPQKRQLPRFLLFFVVFSLNISKSSPYPYSWKLATTEATKTRKEKRSHVQFSRKTPRPSSFRCHKGRELRKGTSAKIGLKSYKKKRYEKAQWLQKRP